MPHQMRQTFEAWKCPTSEFDKNLPSCYNKQDMIILTISTEYLVRIRRNFSSNVRLKTPKLGVKSKFI